MKIIGTDGQSGLFVQVSKDELANLAGFYSEYHLKEKLTLSIGMDLPVASIFRDAAFVLEAYSHIRKDVETQNARLGKLAAMLEKPIAERKEAKK